VLLALWLHHLVAADADDRAGPAAARRRADRRFLILAVGLFPSSVFFSSTGFLRDGWIYWFALLAVTLFAAAIWSGPRVRVGMLVGSVASGVAVGVLRGYAATALALGVALWLLTEPRIPVARWRPRLRELGVAALGVLLVAWFVLRDHLDSRVRSLDAIAQYRAGYTSRAGSNMGIDFRNASPARFALLYLRSLVDNVVGPLPHQVRNLSMAALCLEALVLVATGVLLLRGARRLGPRGRFLVAQAVAWFVLIAVFNDNYGTAARLRVPAWTCLLVALASVLPARDRPDPAGRPVPLVVPLRPPRR
jgi:hypothetical protein